MAEIDACHPGEVRALAVNYDYLFMFNGQSETELIVIAASLPRQS
jgi:hypothetical protein